jgi:hypothetical protein
MSCKTNMTLTALVWAIAALLTTGALARKPGPGFVPPYNPNQPRVCPQLRRMIAETS